MSLREDLIEIAHKEGFESVDSFVQFFVADGNRTFMELKEWIETKYKRYYSWVWVYTYCAPMTPGYKVSKRKIRITSSGTARRKAVIFWEQKSQEIFGKSLNDSFEAWDKSVKEMANVMGVKYTTLYRRYIAWKGVQNVG